MTEIDEAIWNLNMYFYTQRMNKEDTEDIKLIIHLKRK